MAHDFGIKNTKKEDFAFFFGYANGLMYHAFSEEKHDRIISGDDCVEIKTKAETEKALDLAIEQFDAMGYPDPQRLDAIKKFRQDMSGDAPTDTYDVWFG